MNTTKPDGGPAYPIDRMTAAALVRQRNPDILNNDAEYLHEINALSVGMSLRDYFAATAMQGAITSQADILDFGPDIGAAWAYRVADAMLTARGQS